VVRNSSQWSPEESYLSLQSERLVFAVIGDYGLAGPAEESVAELIKSWNPDLIVTTGDNNYPRGSPDTIDQNIGQYFHEFIYPYKGEFGPGASSKRFFPVLGNHDWDSNGASPYFDYFSFFNGRGYYDFVYGPIHFYMIDSDPREPDGVTLGSKQAKWLKNALATSPSIFNIVLMHHPPYSSGPHGPTAYMQWPYEDWGADVVLAGHDHLYERIHMGGIPFIINGIGGGPIYDFYTTTAGSQVRFNQDYGAMRVEVNRTQMRFQAFTRSGILIDEFQLSESVPYASSIQRAGPEFQKPGRVDFTVTFSEAVAGVDPTDFSLSTTGLTGSALVGISGGGANYVVNMATGTGEGTLRLDLLDDDSIRNTDGNPLGGMGVGNGTHTAGQIYAIDDTHPAILAITRLMPSPTNASTVDFSVVFIEPVQEVDPSDFSPSTTSFSGAEILGVLGEGNIYVVSVRTGIGEGTFGLTLAANSSITDWAGNSVIPSNPGTGSSDIHEDYLIDTSPPRVVSSRFAGFGNTSQDLLIEVDFSEPVSGVDESDFSLETNTGQIPLISGFLEGATRYTLSVNASYALSDLSLYLIDDDSILDLAGNPLGGPGIHNGNYSEEKVYSAALAFPSIASITTSSPSPTNASSIEFVVSFSQPVSGVDPGDFLLHSSNLAGSSIQGVSGDGFTYHVTVNAGVGEGELSLSLRDDDSITNALGIPLGGAGMANGEFENGASVSIDRSAPQATSIIRASTNPSDSDTVDFIVTFSEPVNGVNREDFSTFSAEIAEASIVEVSDFNPFFLVRVNTGVGSGNLRLDLSDHGSITDRAGNELGGDLIGDGNFSEGESFTVFKPSTNFPAPRIRNWSRTTITNSSSPLISWFGVWGAQFYEVQTAFDETFSQIVASRVTRGTELANELSLPDGRYFYRVRAYNAELRPGKFSTVQSILIDTTSPPAPNPISPMDGSALFKKPLFTWEVVKEAVAYNIQIDTNPEFTSPDWSSRRKDPDFQLAYMPKGTYYWRVQAKDGAGNWSPWSKVSHFRLP
jgi:hypothetical protein